MFPPSYSSIKKFESLKLELLKGFLIRFCFCYLVAIIVVDRKVKRNPLVFGVASLCKDSEKNLKD